MTETADDHSAIIAADALPWWNRWEWEQAIRRAAARGGNFTSADLQLENDLPDIGNATGGLFMALHRQGVIKRVGYEPSSKGSRAGSVVAIWTGGVNAHAPAA